VRALWVDQEGTHVGIKLIVHHQYPSSQSTLSAPAFPVQHVTGVRDAASALVNRRCHHTTTTMSVSLHM